MTMITPEVLLKAYAAGVFPMAETAEDNALYWIDPNTRGILPLSAFHVPKRLARTVRTGKYQIRINHAFEEVMIACAQATPEREVTWINDRIRRLYAALFKMGRCHSVEAWFEDKLVGGLYGVSLGGAFFGESMFSHSRDASKVALVHLVARLICGGYTLLDAQFQTEHLSQFGALEVERDDYHDLLAKALEVQADFHRFRLDGDGRKVLQSVSQMS